MLPSLQTFQLAVADLQQTSIVVGGTYVSVTGKEQAARSRVL